MIDLKAYDRFYFLGIGGIGMSALARYFQANGYAVAGYDRTPSELTDQLQQEGITIHFDDDIKNIPAQFLEENKAKTLVVLTPAIPKDSVEWKYLQEEGYTIKKRAEVLASLTQGKTTIAVAGTHGKTSTAAMISHILKTANVPFFGFLGGIAANYQTNFIAPESGQADLVVVEADEFDRSFLQLNPDTAIITAVESDHLDIYGTVDELKAAFFEFGRKVKPGGTLIVQEQVMFPKPENAKLITYGAHGRGESKAENVRIEDGQFVFNANLDGLSLPGLKINVPGMHNIENSLAAMTSVKPWIKDTQAYYKALSTFKGVHRRFEVIIKNKDVVYVDDYAHHPTEIKATIDTIKSLYPDKKVLGIFQPHLFTRTRDLAKEFAQSLSALDILFLLPIYPARELPIPGVTSTMILQDAHAPEKKIVEKGQLVQEIANTDADVILTIGAGDIDRMVQRIKEYLENKGKEAKA
jgi:UDP-N-acetylmuramate--alanine ligase